jgi:hypothetical protein
VNPRPESRISSLEKRATAIEAAIEEMSSDTAEELRAIRQELKSSYNEIGDLFDRNFERLAVIETRLDRIDSTLLTLATKDDISRLDGRLDEVLQLLQKKLGE